MSALIGTPPLRTVSSFLEAASPEVVVPVRLKEPLWRTGARVDLLVACMQAQMLLERAYHGSGITCTVDEVYAAHPRVHALLARVCEAAATLQPGPSPLQLLEDTGLAAMAPYVAQLLSGGAFGAHAREHVPAAHEYHEHAAAINQLLTISQQLSRDVSTGVHKYTAHKLALLYHAVNLSKFRREELRRRSAFLLLASPPPSPRLAAGGGSSTKPRAQAHRGAFRGRQGSDGGAGARPPPQRVRDRWRFSRVIFARAMFPRAGGRRAGARARGVARDAVRRHRRYDPAGAAHTPRQAGAHPPLSPRVRMRSS